ncbi:endonuclease/exonuclease/phosphatase family protein [Alysiella crassa]|uniref:Uncharacterized protein conserved in bacteria n=1 Tax=Alysiella crassa TaxID=153491 RepID=A0A376BLX7_9NEIS|nr:endonuclease/exonuclease/phosphatase family protein [Alysiella crassa]UOP07206.1 endonuclease/exonuclease/phosphatase family protein [Alysiella crassa]SSY70623.1 Uncharacterized protein conserved in bacteria [Alysiella crassa]
MKILSYNIQAAIASDSYLSYVSRLHRQVFPTPAKRDNLRHIAQYISPFDVVCLQEVDLGGFRNGYENQVNQFLAQTPFTHHVCQINRVVGKLSVHGNLILSKMPLRQVVNTHLPSRIKGRGMLAAAVQMPFGEMVVANVHLSLGAMDQFKQIRFIRETLKPYEHVCLMGDFNCPPEAEQLHLLTDFDYTRLEDTAHTYPSWKPSQTLDHIFVKGCLKGVAHVSQFSRSDHLPVVVDMNWER